MKSVLSILASLLLTGGAFAQSQDATVVTDSSSARTSAEERQKKIAQEQERAKALLEKKTVVHDGFVHDLRRAESKKKFLSLRQPRDPLNDTKNISADERSGKPRGFVLFRVGF
jgi:hypothetical protein